MLRYLLFAITMVLSTNNFAQATPLPLRIGIAGLSHSHVHGLLGRKDKGDIAIVGIAEPNHVLAERYAKQYGFSMELVYHTLEAMIAAAKPEAVAAFGSIYEHLKVVETAAPKGIHIMVEKPLAVSMEHARKMEALANKHHIQLITNYETTWYPTTHRAHEMLAEGSIGELRKLVVRDGHRGPKKIGVNPEFLEWLTDPVQNGGGALTDFGCYGANLSTWLYKGQRPISVTSVTQQLQPENNPKVDDDATIILNYPQGNTIIQASWNWPMGRKDVELYGLKGAIYADNGRQLRLRMAEGYDGFTENSYNLDPLKGKYEDPFSFFAGVIRKEIVMQPFELSSLENNMLVVEILDASSLSAKTGKTVNLGK